MGYSRVEQPVDSVVSGIPQVDIAVPVHAGSATLIFCDNDPSCVRVEHPVDSVVSGIPHVDIAVPVHAGSATLIF